MSPRGCHRSEVWRMGSLWETMERWNNETAACKFGALTRGSLANTSGAGCIHCDIGSRVLSSDAGEQQRNPLRLHHCPLHPGCHAFMF